MIGRLEELWEDQREFMELLVEKRGFPKFPLDLSKKDSQVFCKGIAYDAMGELWEAVRELKNSKSHRATNIPELDRASLVEEMADCLHYFLELCMLIGITPDELCESFLAKGEKNKKRIRDGY